MVKLALAAVLPLCGDMLAAEGEYEGTTREPALVLGGDAGGVISALTGVCTDAFVGVLIGVAVVTDTDSAFPSVFLATFPAAFAGSLATG